MILNKIIKGQDIFTENQKYRTTRNIFTSESLKVLEKKTRDWGIETNSNYKLVIKDTITH